MDRHGAIKLLQIWFCNCVTSLTVLSTISSGRPYSYCRHLLLSYAGRDMCRYELKRCIYIYIYIYIYTVCLSSKCTDFPMDELEM
jgi:hypothetical protein